MTPRMNKPWFFNFSGGTGGYQPVPTDDSMLGSNMAKSPFSFESIHTYDHPDKCKDGPRGYRARLNKKYKSVFAWNESKSLEGRVRDRDVEGVSVEKQGCLLGLVCLMITGISYIIFISGFPIMYWFCVLKLGQADRLVVFRLGKMIGVKGPGRVLIFPWMDRYKLVDVRASAFSVPPQQFITNDGGIAEMGAEVQYAITDVTTMVRELADHQDILRSLGKTLLTKVLVKRSLSQLKSDKRISAQVICDELNEQVRKWGLDVRSVSLSDPKVLKEAGQASAMNPILQGLGLRDAKEYPTPQQFVRATWGLEEEQNDDAAAFGSLASAVGGFMAGDSNNFSQMDLAKQATANMQMFEGMAGGGIKPSGNVEMKGGNPQPASKAKSASKSTIGGKETSSTHWRRCLEQVMKEAGALEDEAHGLYRIDISQTENGDENFFLELTPLSRRVLRVEDSPDRKADVHVSLSSSDLAGVLGGSVSPLQAYLTGRISATGDVRKLMLFDKISNRGHKPGSMFDI